MKGRRLVAARTAVPALLSAALLAGCAAPRRAAEVTSIRPEPAYEALYPIYAEICALSQYRSLKGILGGTPGHAVMYLKGACRMPDAPFPTLELCDPPSNDPKSPQHGAGVSVNRAFRNVNWVAFPGKELFLDGNLEPDDLLDQAHYDATLRAAVETGVFRGIEMHPRFLETKPADQTSEEFLASLAIGTDYALRFSRNLWCARMPITRPMLEQAVAYLNALNREYAEGEADYQWSGYQDNCAHALRNALAHAGVWKGKSVREVKLRQLFNVAVPANEFVNLGRLGNEYSLESFGRIYGDDVKRRSLREYDWLPTRHGALVKRLAIHQNNELYDRQARLFVLEPLLLRPRSRAGQRLLSDPRFTHVESNLRYFLSRYEKILKERPERRRRADDVEREVTRRRYYDYIEAQRAEVEEMLARLYALGRGRKPR